MTARKIMLLGEIGVGKSSLVRRLVTDKFDYDYKPTIGVEVYTYEVPGSVTGSPLSLVIFDTDGNLRDTIYSHVYVKEAAAALIVGDVKRRSTLQTMIGLANGFVERLPGRFYSFLTNKSDLVSEEDEPLPGGLRRPGVPLVATSALTGEMVRDAFHDAARTIHRRGL